MLKEPLFKIVSLNHNDNLVTAILEINQASEIFEGHFPDQPIVPGASMLQIVKDILADALNSPLRLVKADNIKFLSLVEPGANHQLQLAITYQLIENDIKINANLAAGDVVCMKLQGVFQSAKK